MTNGSHTNDIPALQHQQLCFNPKLVEVGFTLIDKSLTPHPKKEKKKKDSLQKPTNISALTQETESLPDI